MVDNGVVVGGSLCDGCLWCRCGCRSIDFDKVFVVGGCAWMLVGGEDCALVVDGDLLGRDTGDHIVRWGPDEAIGNTVLWPEFGVHKCEMSLVVAVYANLLR